MTCEMLSLLAWKFWHISVCSHAKESALVNFYKCHVQNCRKLFSVHFSAEVTFSIKAFFIYNVAQFTLFLSGILL